MLVCLNGKSSDGRAPEGGFAEVSFCETKQKLIEDFVEAVHEISVLQKQQTQAAVDDDQDFSRFDVLLHLAQERKEAAKYAWIVHVETHQCRGGELRGTHAS